MDHKNFKQPPSLVATPQPRYMPPLTIQPFSQTSGELLYSTSLFQHEIGAGWNGDGEADSRGNSALSGRKINLLDLPEGLHAWLDGKDDGDGGERGGGDGAFSNGNGSKLEIIRRARMTTKELHQRRLKYLSTSLACMESYSQHRVLLSKQVSDRIGPCGPCGGSSKSHHLSPPLFSCNPFHRNYRHTLGIKIYTCKSHTRSSRI